MICLALMGFINGLITTRTLKFFGTTDWAFTALISSTALPIFLYVCLTLEIVFNAAAGGYSEETLWYKLFMTIGWIAINVVSNLFGAYKGYLLPRAEAASKVSSLTREIPPQPKACNLTIVMLLFGGIQFLAVSVEFSSMF